MEEERKSLEELQKELDAEAELWQQEGMAMNMVQHTNESIFILKQQIQAMMNIMLRHITDEEEINIEFKTIMLSSMKELRRQYLDSRKETVAGMVRPGLALPEHRLLGPDGKEVKF